MSKNLVVNELKLNIKNLIVEYQDLKNMGYLEKSMLVKKQIELEQNKLRSMIESGENEFH